MGKHHRTHKKKDSATIYKQKAMNSILRKKKITAWLFKSLIVISVLLFLFVVIIYSFD